MDTDALRNLLPDAGLAGMMLSPLHRRSKAAQHSTAQHLFSLTHGDGLHLTKGRSAARTWKTRGAAGHEGFPKTTI